MWLNVLNQFRIKRDGSRVTAGLTFCDSRVAGRYGPYVSLPMSLRFSLAPTVQGSWMFRTFEPNEGAVGVRMICSLQNRPEILRSWVSTERPTRPTRKSLLLLLAAAVVLQIYKLALHTARLTAF